MVRKDQSTTTVARQPANTPDTHSRRRAPVRRRSSTVIRVGKRGQIVLPAAIRRELGIEDGSTLAVRADEQGQIVLKSVPSDPVARLRETLGSVYRGVDVEAYIRELREEWDRD